MADESPQGFFVERVVNMSHANGVFRVTFGQQAEGDAVRALVRLMIPANQLAPILQGISNAAREIGEQVQARLKDAQEPAKNGDEESSEKAKARSKK